jgi:hypothetical protein
MQTRRNARRCAAVLLFAFVLVSVVSVARSDRAPRSGDAPARAVVSIATGVSPTIVGNLTPSQHVVFGALLAYLVAALAFALATTFRTRSGLSARALLARAGLGRRGRAPPFVRS